MKTTRDSLDKLSVTDKRFGLPVTDSEVDSKSVKRYGFSLLRFWVKIKSCQISSILVSNC